MCCLEDPEHCRLGYRKGNQSDELHTRRRQQRSGPSDYLYASDPRMTQSDSVLAET